MFLFFAHAIYYGSFGLNVSIYGMFGLFFGRDSAASIVFEPTLRAISSCVISFEDKDSVGLGVGNGVKFSTGLIFLSYFC